MAVFLDLDLDDNDDGDRDNCNGPLLPHHLPPSGFPPPPAHGSSSQHLGPQSLASLHRDETNDAVEETGSVRLNPNVNGFSAAVACYPIITQITHSIDLNTLHALSRTCRQIRVNLLQYRNRLVRQTLRCSNEEGTPPLVSPNGYSMVNGENGVSVFRATSSRIPCRSLGEYGGRVGGYVPCARDLVSECRRCERVICRNCTLKPPSSSALPSRRRRLCPACLSAPLPHLLLTTLSSPCACSFSVHLCLPCGSSLSASDRTYARVRAWRTRYSFTGLGEGDEDSRCWRGDACLSAEEREFEAEVTDNQEGEASSGGYERQEVVGVGGVVKKKGLRRVTVGGRVLGAEEEMERSWCGWCERVIVGGS